MDPARSPRWVAVLVCLPLLYAAGYPVLMFLAGAGAISLETLIRAETGLYPWARTIDGPLFTVLETMYKAGSWFRR